jgi:hypothetical protein
MGEEARGNNYRTINHFIKADEKYFTIVNDRLQSFIYHEQLRILI